MLAYVSMGLRYWWHRTSFVAAVYDLQPLSSPVENPKWIEDITTFEFLSSSSLAEMKCAYVGTDG